MQSCSPWITRFLGGPTFMDYVGTRSRLQINITMNTCMYLLFFRPTFCFYTATWIICSSNVFSFYTLAKAWGKKSSLTSQRMKITFHHLSSEIIHLLYDKKNLFVGWLIHWNSGECRLSAQVPMWPEGPRIRGQRGLCALHRHSLPSPCTSGV